MLYNNGQNNIDKDKMGDYIIPQLDSTHNVSEHNDSDSHNSPDLVELTKPNTRARKQRQKVPDDETIDIDKIVKDNTPRYVVKQELKDVLQARKLATEIERKQRETERLAAEKARKLLIELN